MILSPLQLNPHWKVRCYLNGTQYEAVSFPKLDLALDDWFKAQPSTCVIELVDIVPSDVAYTIMEIQVSVDGGTSWHPYFFGYAQPKEVSLFGFSRTVTGIDILYLLDKDASEEIAWDGATYLEAIEDILVDAGIPAALINLPSSLDDLTARNSITRTISTDDNLKDVLAELLKFGRYVVYVDASGGVRMRKYSTVPEASATIKFSTDDVQDDEYGIATQRFGRQVEVSDQVVRKVIVDAADSETEVFGSWETTSSKAANGKTISDSNKFARTEAQCEEMATDWGQDECRNNNTTTFACGSDTEIRPGLCIELKSAANGFDDFTPARVIKTSIGRGLMTVTVSSNPRAIGSGDSGGEGLAEDGYDEESGPTADFSYTVEREGGLYGVILQSTSTSDASEIETFSWSVSGAGAGYPAPPFGATAKEMTVIDTLSGVTITLDVTDANSASDSVTKTIASDDIDVYTRQLQAVVDDAWLVLLDYDSGWFDITPAGKTAAIVPRASDTNYMFAAMTDGTIWRYDVDDSGTDAVQVASLSGTPADIAQGEAFVSEDSANCVIVGHGSSVSVSYNALAATPVWSTKVFATTVLAVGVNPHNTAVLFACAGNTLYISYDSGVSWTAETTGEIGSTAVDFCTFPWSPGVAVLFTGYSNLIDAVLPSQAEWGGVTPDGALQSITPGLEDEVLRISSDAGEIFLVAADGTITETQDGTDTSDIDRLVRDGHYNRVVWLADNSTFGVGKQVADADVFSIKSATTGATSVGYAQIISLKETPVKPTRAGLVWMGENGAWVYRSGAWTWVEILASGKEDGMTWRSVSVDSTDPLKVVAFYNKTDYIRDDGEGFYLDGAHPAWRESPWRYSDDGGETWYELRIGSAATGGQKVRVALAGNGCFLHDGKFYTVVGAQDFGTNQKNQYIVYGETPVWNASGYYEIPSSAVRGPFQVTATDYNHIVAFCRADDDDNGNPLIPWISRYSRDFGYFSYDPDTDTVAMNKRTYTGCSSNSIGKLLSSIIGSHEAFFSAVGRISCYFSDYRSSNSVANDIANENSFNYVAKHASDENGVLYTVEDRYTKPNRLEPPYSTGQDVSALDNRNWRVVARNEQTGSRGRYIAVGAYSGTKDSTGVAIYDVSKDTWTDIPLDSDIIDAGMSEDAFAVFAE